MIYRCGAKGLFEKIPGNKTHDAVCIGMLTCEYFHYNILAVVSHTVCYKIGRVNEIPQEFLKTLDVVVLCSST